jgi:5-methylcytosine-specific restriction protein B
MTEQEVGTFARVAAVGVEKIGRRLIDSGLGKDDSLLTPGRPVWTLENLDELTRDYVDRPDAGTGGFFEKLSQQLADSSPEAVQLFTELLILNMLPITNVGGLLKVKQVREVLNLSVAPVELPQDVEAALAGGGVFNGGQAFTSNRWAQIVYLIQLAKHFKSLPSQRQVDALSDPLSFRGEVNEVPTGHGAQKQSVLYLGFPHFYLPIVNVKHRKTFRDGMAPEYLAGRSGDLDVDIARIYEALTEEQGGHVDVYAEPWRSRWEKKPRPPVPPVPEVQHAWKIHGSNVKGLDMVPIWREKQSVSLAATLLRQIQSDVSRTELKQIVDEDYHSSGYAAREEKLEEFFTFLNRIHPGDLVASVDEGAVHIGIVADGAEWVSSSDGRSNLRRTVDWYEHPCPLSDVPGEVVARLDAQGEVVDLSQHLDILTALAERRRPTTDVVTLPDASDALAESLHVGVDWLQECIELLRERRQIIFYGPPGTGKTFIAQRLAQHVTDKSRVKIVQFHPAYSYEDFFEGFRPREGSDGQIGFALKAGPLRSLVDKAVENPEAAFVLIIDEINRGNLPKIFGELYYLLEYRDQSIDLMYSSDSSEPFSLPKNIFVIGTMNTADRSIALVDAALRRRFAFLTLHPAEEPTSGILRSWLATRGFPAEVADIHDALNARISDSDFKIGPSYFMREKVANDPTGAGLKRMWRTDILPLLEEHHFGERNINVAERYGLEGLRRAAVSAALTIGDEQLSDSAVDGDHASSADTD